MLIWALPSGNWRGHPLPQERMAPSWHYSQGQQVGGSQHSWEPCPAAQPKWPAIRTASDAQMEEQAQLLWVLSDQGAPRSRTEGSGPPKGSVPTKKRQDREVRFSAQADRPAVAPTSPARAKPGPTQRDEQRSNGEGGCQEGFRPPAPTVCPSQKVSCPVRQGPYSGLTPLHEC